MTERFKEASLVSHILLFVLFALQWDGAGRLAHAPWWLIGLMSTTPMLAAFLIEAAAFTIKRLAHFFRSR